MLVANLASHAWDPHRRWSWCQGHLWQTLCALAVAKLTNIYSKELFEGTAQWLLKWQTYEGGFAGCPNQEAHGGYTFCALAALTLLGQESQCNFRNLLVILLKYICCILKFDWIFGMFFCFRDGPLIVRWSMKAAFKAGPTNWLTVAIHFGKGLSSHCYIFFWPNQVLLKY